MRTHISHPWVAAAALGTASILAACADAEDDPDLPRVTVPQRVVLNAGACGDVASGTLALTNQGDVEARFTLRSPDLRIMLAPARGTLAPGERLEVDVIAAVPLDAIPGEMLSAPVTAEIHGDRAYTVPVSFLARGATIVIDPPLIGIGQVPVGFRSVRPFTVRNDGNATVSVAIGKASAEVDVRFRRTKLGPGDEVHGEVGYLPLDLGADTGVADVTVFGATCGPPPGKLVVVGEGVAGDVLQVQGGPIDFGAEACDLPAAPRRLALVNPAAIGVLYAAEVVPDGATEPAFTVTPGRGRVPANGWTFVDVAPREDARVPGERDAVVRITSWLGRAIVADVAIHETVLGVALHAETSADFGAVPVGEMARVPLMITNTGNVPARLELALAGPFTVDLPTWIDPGDKVIGEVRYEPKTAGWHTTALTIFSPGACAPPLTLTYKGEGVEVAD